MEKDLTQHPQYGTHIPTMNRKGVQMATTSPLLQAWIKSYDGKNPLLDCGCAYGINTYPALELGTPVIALDMDERHLKIVERNVSSSKSQFLTCLLGTLPHDIPIPDSSVSGILLAEVIHFLQGHEIRAALSVLFQKLVSGGHIFVTAASIHCFDNIDQTFVDTFYGKLNTGDKWPGLTNYDEDIMSKLVRSASCAGGTFDLGTGHPEFVHFFVLQQLKEEIYNVGFEIKTS